MFSWSCQHSSPSQTFCWHRTQGFENLEGSVSKSPRERISWLWFLQIWLIPNVNWGGVASQSLQGFGERGQHYLVYVHSNCYPESSGQGQNPPVQLFLSYPSIALGVLSFSEELFGNDKYSQSPDGFGISNSVSGRARRWSGGTDSKYLLRSVEGSVKMNCSLGFYWSVSWQPPIFE